MISFLKKIFLSFLPETLLALFTKYKLFMSMLLLTILPVALKWTYYIISVQFLEFLENHSIINLQGPNTNSLPCQLSYIVNTFKIDSVISILMGAYITSLVISLIRFK